MDDDVADRQAVRRTRREVVVAVVARIGGVLLVRRRDYAAGKAVRTLGTGLTGVAEVLGAGRAGEAASTFPEAGGEAVDAAAARTKAATDAAIAAGKLRCIVNPPRGCGSAGESKRLELPAAQRQIPVTGRAPAERPSSGRPRPSSIVRKSP